MEETKNDEQTSTPVAATVNNTDVVATAATGTCSGSGTTSSSTTEAAPRFEIKKWNAGKCRNLKLIK